MSFKSVTESGVLKTSFRELMKGVYTCVPGHVITLLGNGQSQRAQVQVGIERVDINGASFEIKPIIDVPVCFPGDQWAVEYQIDPGCEGMIFFSQRCTDGWKNTGGVAQNPIGRFHDLQDAFFIPGFRSMPNVLPSFTNNGIRLRNKAGTQFVWLRNDGTIYVENGMGHIRMEEDGTVVINGVTFDTTGRVVAPRDVLWNGGATSGEGHRHSGVESGPDISGPPVV